jgi:hypothetical protein
MSMDAHQLNPWQQRTSQLVKDRTRKMIFFDVESVLLNIPKKKVINQNNLLFALSHLWQAGHILGIVTNIAHTDKDKTHLIQQMAATILHKTGVPLMVLTPQSFDQQERKKQLRDDHGNKHQNLSGKNATIMLSLAACQLYCTPNALQHKLIMDPGTRLPGETKAMHVQRQAIASEQVVLVDGNATAIHQARAIGYQGIVASNYVAIGKAQGSNHPHHLQQLLANYTTLAQRSQAWLHQRHNPVTTQTHQGMNWLHYQYYLRHFQPHMGSQQNRHVHKRAWQQCAPTPKHTTSWAQRGQKSFMVMMTGGVAVACISTGLHMGGMGGAMGVAAAGIGMKILMAKAGMGFGIGSAFSSMMITLKKYFFWRKKQGKKRALKRWLRSQQMINDMLKQASANQALLAQPTRPTTTPLAALYSKSYHSLPEQWAHSLEHRSHRHFIDHSPQEIAANLAMRHADRMHRGGG